MLNASLIVSIVLGITTIVLFFAFIMVSAKNKNLVQEVTNRNIMIQANTEQIKTLFANIERLSSYEMRCKDLEDDISRLDKVNLRIETKRIMCPLNDTHLKFINKLIISTYQNPNNYGNRKNLEILMDIQNRILEILSDHTEWSKVEKSKEDIVNNKKKKYKTNTKNVIGKVD